MGTAGLGNDGPVVSDADIQMRGIRVGKTLRSRWGLLALTAALMMALVTFPAAGEHVPEESDVLRLHLGTDGKYFKYEPVVGDPVTQQIPAPVRCELGNRVDGPLVKLSGNNRGPGLVDVSIGVKTGGSQGIPCSRVDSNEHLTMSLVGVPVAVAAEFDLELKGDVEVKLELSSGETFTVRSASRIVAGDGVDGTSGVPFVVRLTSENPIGNCRNAANSGPDAGAQDNCRVIIDPDLSFSSVTFRSVSGEISLEGSGDFGNDPAFDTIFYLQTEEWDGEIACGETVRDKDGDVTAKITRYQNTDDSECLPKLFRLLADKSNPEENGAATVTFEFPDTDTQAAIYEAHLTFNQPLDSPLDAVLQYDPEPPYDNFKNMPRCESDPFDAPQGSLDPGAIPARHEGCVISVTQTWHGLTTWHAIFEGDWRFK
ncbi:hypothetical protein BH23ACT5_BH23ACT5_04950 [soil metagenome]